MDKFMVTQQNTVCPSCLASHHSGNKVHYKDEWPITVAALSLAQTLESRIRILLGAWKSVRLLLCSCFPVQVAAL
jgi:hypothetical protein